MNRISNARGAALGAMLTALAVIFLFFASVFPSGRYATFAIATFFTAVMVIEGGVALALMTYFATGMLAFLIIPDKIFAVFYLLFYGYYGVLKAKIERIGQFWIEWLLKIAIYMVIVYIALYLLKGIIHFVLPPFLVEWQIVGVAVFSLIIYDVAYTYAIQFYLNRLQKMIQKALRIER